MKSYLSLISISSKVHKRQNRMTLLCIIISVFLVTAIFSMADAGIGMEKERAIDKHGNWHILLTGISKTEAESIGVQSNVAAASWYDVINYDLDENYSIGSKKALICGTQEQFAEKIMPCISEGKYPKEVGEVILTENAKELFQINIGDSVSLQTPIGIMNYTVSGFGGNTSFISQKDAVGVITGMNTLEDIQKLNKIEKSSSTYYVQFKTNVNVQRAKAEIREKYSLEENNISENTALLGIIGASSNSYLTGSYVAAGVLFFLILIAGILMIAGSINTNVSERSRFFGMLRCIGASKKQVIRIVTLEALSWCKTAVPIGVGSGMVATWIICALLHFAVGGEFASIPIFIVSPIGIISGITSGMLTVLIAARIPAKHASKVSPVAAVTGGTEESKKVKHSAKARFFKIDIALGIHHAVSSKKNLVLMTGSFALSIVVFLAFSTVLDFTRYAITSLRPYAPDISIMSYDNSCSVPRELTKEIDAKRIFGRMYQSLPAKFENKDSNIDLISYEDYQFNWAEEEKDIISGDLSKVLSNDNYVMTVFDKSNSLSVGDKIETNGKTLEVACVLSDSPFDVTDIPTVICSEETFKGLTGKNDYAVIDIQLDKNATDDDVNKIRTRVGEGFMFSDRRATNKEASGTYWAFNILAYGFLFIISMITVFNIINSISMSVSARTKMYGVMNAVGMDKRQITKMITAETITYSLVGCVIGCLIGLPVNKFLFEQLITAHWGVGWSIPIGSTLTIIVLVVLASFAAVYAPAKRINSMIITDTINEL